MHALKALSLSLVVVSSSLAAEPLKLFPGWRKELSLPGVEKVASSAPAVAEAQVSKSGVVLHAKAPGAATVRAWKKGAAQPELVTVQVDSTGWTLVAVVVAARDIDEGSTLAAADLATASLPEAVVTTSLVRSDAVARVLGHKTLVPIQAGDVVWWAVLQASAP